MNSIAHVKAPTIPTRSLRLMSILLVFQSPSTTQFDHRITVDAPMRVGNPPEANSNIPAVGLEGTTRSGNLSFAHDPGVNIYRIPDISDLGPVTEQLIDGYVLSDPSRVMDVIKNVTLPEPIRAYAAEASINLEGLNQQARSQLRSALFSMLLEGETLQIAAIRGLTQFEGDDAVRTTIASKVFDSESRYVRTAANEALLLLD